jgi:staphyloferrin B biosynthesis citrate synthase
MFDDASLISFRERLRTGSPLHGLFLKFPTPASIEMLATTPLDVLVIDAEHAPVSPENLGACLLAAASWRRPCLVRLSDASLPPIQQAIGLGAAGFLIPHVNDDATARNVVEFARTRAAERVVAGLCRAAGYQGALTETSVHRVASRLSIVLQIDELEGVANIERIAAVEGVDAIFIGRLGLSLRHGTIDSLAAPVRDDMWKIARACRANGRALGLYLTNPNQVAQWRAEGASLFVIGSDSTLLTEATSRHLAAFQAQTTPAKP